MNDINCWQPQIMKTLCGHLALFEALTRTPTHTDAECLAVDSYPCNRVWRGEAGRGGGAREMDGGWTDKCWVFSVFLHTEASPLPHHRLCPCQSGNPKAQNPSRSSACDIFLLLRTVESLLQFENDIRSPLSAQMCSEGSRPGVQASRSRAVPFRLSSQFDVLLHRYWMQQGFRVRIRSDPIRIPGRCRWRWQSQNSRMASLGSGTKIISIKPKLQ